MTSEQRASRLTTAQVTGNLFSLANSDPMQHHPEARALIREAAMRLAILNKMSDEITRAMAQRPEQDTE